MLKKFFCYCAIILCCLGSTNLAFAGNYPDHPIQLMTMTKPGAQIDLLTRAVAEALKKDLGQPVLVINVPGGSHGSESERHHLRPRSSVENAERRVRLGKERRPWPDVYVSGIR